MKLLTTLALAGLLGTQFPVALYQSGDQVPADSDHYISDEEYPGSDYSENDDSFGGFGEDEGFFINPDETNDHSDIPGTSAYTIDTPSEITGESFFSDGDDENALLITGVTAFLDQITVNKNGGESSSLEDGDFYGVNAALLARDQAQVTITNSTIHSDATNGNAVFSYGEGTSVDISDSEIITFGDHSGGIQTTGGASTSASNLEVTTYGDSSAAIRSDRGGGTVQVSQGNYVTRGYNSPAVYSTAEISVDGANLQAANSEALVVEGANSISLSNSSVTGNMSSSKGSSSGINVHNVMLYQSMSGDASEGLGRLAISDSELTAQNGDQFFITNTQAQVYLTRTTLNNANNRLFTITGNDGSLGWGQAGSNGAGAEIYVNEQDLSGDIVVDTISAMTLSLASVNYSGSINIVENEAGNLDISHAVVVLDENSTWNLSDDCTISELYNNGTINFNGHTITLADGTVLSAEGEDVPVNPSVPAGDQNTGSESQWTFYLISAAGALSVLGFCMLLLKKKAD